MINVTQSDNVATKIIVVTYEDLVFINGEPAPLCPSKRKNHNTTVIDGKVYIDGYELKNGKWKRTLKALWHLWF